MLNSLIELPNIVNIIGFHFKILFYLKRNPIQRIWDRSRGSTPSSSSLADQALFFFLAILGFFPVTSAVHLAIPNSAIIPGRSPTACQGPPREQWIPLGRGGSHFASGLILFSILRFVFLCEFRQPQGFLAALVFVGP